MLERRQIVGQRTKIANVFCKVYGQAETFRKIGGIIKDEILPTDWHFESTVYMDDLGVITPGRRWEDIDFDHGMGQTYPRRRYLPTASYDAAVLA